MGHVCGYLANNKHHFVFYFKKHKPDQIKGFPMSEAPVQAANPKRNRFWSLLGFADEVWITALVGAAIIRYFKLRISSCNLSLTVDMEVSINDHKWCPF
jgi:hypothetical protein